MTLKKQAKPGVFFCFVSCSVIKQAVVHIRDKLKRSSVVHWLILLHSQRKTTFLEVKASQIILHGLTIFVLTLRSGSLHRAPIYVS